MRIGLDKLHTKTIHLLLFLCFLFPPILFAEEKSFAPPSFFTVFSEMGNEKFTATCKKQGEDMVACDFIGATIDPPATNGKIAQMLRDLDGGPSEKRSSIARKIEQDKVNWSNDPSNEEFLSLLQQKMKDPATRPRTKAYMADVVSSLLKADIIGFLRAEAAKESKTCRILAQKFSLNFKRIGPRKWLHDTGPSGICNLVKIYELERRDDADLWHMKETIVSAGRDDSICKDIAEDVGKVRAWSWREPFGYEPECDFLVFY